MGYSNEKYKKKKSCHTGRAASGSGNRDAAENAAFMYSLLGCCKASDVNPREWLTDVLARIPEYNDYTLDLADLLPHNWKASKKL